MSSTLLSADDMARFVAAPGALPESEWFFDDVPVGDDDDDLICLGADLAPGSLVSAYSNGFFPMPVGRDHAVIGWFSPDPRGVIPIGGLHVSRSLRTRLRRFHYSVDTDFEAVMRACGDQRRPHGWIDEDFVDAYTELHRLGWAHSVEVRLDGRLVGGVYGVRIERFFAGESMFHHATDASKAALVALMEVLETTGFTLFDVQWTTPHLMSLGAVDVPRPDYLRRLNSAVRPLGRGKSGSAPTD